MNQKINTTVLTSIKLETYNIWIHIRGEELKSMILEGKKIGFALTGSFCTFKKTIPQIAKLIEEGAEVLPIMSFNSYNINSRFGEANEFIKKIEEIKRSKAKSWGTDRIWINNTRYKWGWMGTLYFYERI